MRSPRGITSAPAIVPAESEGDLATHIRSWTSTTVVPGAIILLNEALTLAYGIFRH
jgi:hypothetical protein